ncbi:hypothetical protein NBRC116583_39040 [Arenicella sp. 4NH20-0111]|uniref:hypothetical protein n=1 Tax=Arenicella sp. 4NH20-0111 TaxID=3127648 RepID=UPI003105AD02
MFILVRTSKAIAKLGGSLLFGVLTLSIISFVVVWYFFLSFTSLEHNGNLRKIGLQKARKVEVQWLPFADSVLHYKFSANRQDIDSIIETMKLFENVPEGTKKIAHPMFFYPISGEKETYFVKAGYASLYLYFYPDRELAYYVHHDP